MALLAKNGFFGIFVQGSHHAWLPSTKNKCHFWPKEPFLAKKAIFGQKRHFQKWLFWPKMSLLAKNGFFGIFVLGSHHRRSEANVKRTHLKNFRLGTHTHFMDDPLKFSSLCTLGVYVIRAKVACYCVLSKKTNNWKISKLPLTMRNAAQEQLRRLYISQLPQFPLKTYSYVS